MRKELITGLIVIVAIATIMMFSGCVEEKISAADDINMSASLMDSGLNRFDKIDRDIEAGVYSSSKIGLMASKTDYKEALKILNNATTDYEEEKDIIRLNKILCNYNLDYIESYLNLINCLDHMDKSSAYLVAEDIDKSRYELKLAENDLNSTLPSIRSAKEKIFGIDINTVPIESKSNIQECRADIELSENMVLEMGEIISGMCPFFDGMEHTIKATEYMEKEEWHNAELELGETSTDFSKSRNIFMSLENSEFTEVSTTSIEMLGVLGKMIEAIEHYETGCKYVDEGSFEKALDEFMKGDSVFLGTTW
jgi:tetratricopeptide (TPR) repeat protein